MQTFAIEMHCKLQVNLFHHHYSVATHQIGSLDSGPTTQIVTLGAPLKRQFSTCRAASSDRSSYDGGKGVR